MASKPSKQDEAAKLLNDLDNLDLNAVSSTPSSIPIGPTAVPNDGQAADVLAFLDEITLKSSEPTKTTASHIERPISRAGTPTLRKSTERVKLGGGTPISQSKSGDASAASAPPASAGQSGSTSPWGWGSVWNSASAAMKQVQTVVDEQVKHLPTTDAKKWTEDMMEYAKTSQLEQMSKDFRRIALSNLTELLNVVAPPIAEHEVIQVWLSHDMKGYDGIESLVYRSLARIMEQVEGGDLIVNRGAESKPKESSSDTLRDLNAVEGLEAAYKLAEANIDELIKANEKLPAPTESSIQSPTTKSNVFLRIQPVTSTLRLPTHAFAPTDNRTPSASTSQVQLQFLLHFVDPGHSLVHSALTQTIPASWLDVWDQYDWVEDSVVESLRVCVEVIGQDYITARMGWIKGEEPTKSSDEAIIVEKPI